MRYITTIGLALFMLTSCTGSSNNEPLPAPTPIASIAGPWSGSWASFQGGVSGQLDVVFIQDPTMAGTISTSLVKAHNAQCWLQDVAIGTFDGFTMHLQIGTRTIGNPTGRGMATVSFIGEIDISGGGLTGTYAFSGIGPCGNDTGQWLLVRQ